MWTKYEVIKGQASWVKMTSPGGKLTTLAYHPALKVNKAEELTYLLTNTEVNWKASNHEQKQHMLPTDLAIKTGELIAPHVYY